MKKTLLFTFFIASLLIAGCAQQTLTSQQEADQPVDTICERGNTENCNRSCDNDRDCKDACGAGCINIDEIFDWKQAEIDCTASRGCKCVDSACKSK